MEDAEEFCIEDEEEEKEKGRPVIKNAMDLQRLKLEKLMKNPEKPIIIPEPPKEKDFMQSVPTFVRNVMGSSAGAGSGEFHVYRHLRRKEYARQKYIQAKSIREQLDEEYRQKLEKNKLDAEAKTAKRRAKRLKRKEKMKQKGKRRKVYNGCNKNNEESSSETSESENDEETGQGQSDEGTKGEDVPNVSMSEGEGNDKGKEVIKDEDKSSSPTIDQDAVQRETNDSKTSGNAAEGHEIDKDEQCIDTGPPQKKIDQSEENGKSGNP